MKKYNELVFNFYQKQKGFCYLKSINLYRNIDEDGCLKYSLNITLCEDPYYADLSL